MFTIPQTDHVYAQAVLSHLRAMGCADEDAIALAAYCAGRAKDVN